MQAKWNVAHRAALGAALGAALLAMAGCAEMKASVPGAQPLAQGLHVVPGLPADALPDNAKPFPHAAFVLLAADSAVGLLVPLPFISGAVSGAMDARTAAAAEAHYEGIDPRRIVERALRGSPVLTPAAQGAALQAFAFVQECVDERYRLALVAHVTNGGWSGRYLVHLPTAWPLADYRNPSPAVLAGLRRELDEGAVALRALLERAARGELAPSGTRADLGSLNLVGSKVGGLVSPTLLLARDVDLIEEGPDHVIFRSAGKPTEASSAGGLFFGVHRLRKDQLHTFNRLPPKKG